MEVNGEPAFLLLWKWLDAWLDSSANQNPVWYHKVFIGLEYRDLDTGSHYAIPYKFTRVLWFWSHFELTNNQQLKLAFLWIPQWAAEVSVKETIAIWIFQFSCSTSLVKRSLQKLVGRPLSWHALILLPTRCCLEASSEICFGILRAAKCEEEDNR